MFAPSIVVRAARNACVQRARAVLVLARGIPHILVRTWVKYDRCGGTKILLYATWHWHKPTNQTSATLARNYYIQRSRGPRAVLAHHLGIACYARCAKVKWKRSNKLDATIAVRRSVGNSTIAEPNFNDAPQWELRVEHITYTLCYAFGWLVCWPWYYTKTLYARN